MTTKIIMTDGSRSETLYRVKSINPYTDETPGVWVPDYAKSTQAKSTRLVPSVFAGISARMQAMADLPFTIYSVKGDKPMDESDNYKNVLGFLPYPSSHFSLTEGALVVAGQSYWFKGVGARTGNTKELKYWLPSSVRLEPENAKKGVIKFMRTGVNEPFDVTQVLYTWLLDPEVELGPPNVWPLASALIAAEANGAISGWVRDYMMRGAVKAMLLMVDGNPPPGEVLRVETWFNKFMTGARGLAWKVFQGQGVKPTVIGDGLESLKDLSINKELRYEIHQALGTRHLLEDENFATASARERQFYTITIMPDARLIQVALNEQILHAAGYHLEFEPERLEVFQTDEAERAGSLSQLFGVLKEALAAPQALKLAMEILGYDISKDQQSVIDEGLSVKEKERADLAKQMEQKPPVPPPSNEQPPTPPATPNKALIELDRWENKVTKAGKMVTWHAVDITPETAKAITDGALSFADARNRIGASETPNDAAMVLEGIRLALSKA